MKHRTRLGLVFAAYAFVAQANEIVYVPNNPSFGGNPLNGPVLLNSANAQNKYKDPAVTDALSRLNGQSLSDSINQQLQSLILSRVGGAVGSNLFDANGRLIPGGFVQTSDFIIQVNAVPNSNPPALEIVTTDRRTGASTSVFVNQ